MKDANWQNSKYNKVNEFLVQLAFYSMGLAMCLVSEKLYKMKLLNNAYLCLLAGKNRMFKYQHVFEKQRIAV